MIGLLVEGLRVSELDSVVIEMIREIGCAIKNEEIGRLSFHLIVLRPLGIEMCRP